jgi:hypothetical protein
MSIVDITVENDSDFARGFTYLLVNDDGSNGPPINLTGNKMRMGIRHHASDVIEELLLTTENNGIVITDGVNGKFTVLITQDQLLQMPTGGYEHSLVRITAANTFHVWSGSLTVNPGASR